RRRTPARTAAPKRRWWRCSRRSGADGSSRPRRDEGVPGAVTRRAGGALRCAILHGPRKCGEALTDWTVGHVGKLEAVGPGMRTRADIMAWRRAERVRLQEARRALGRAEREASTARIAELLQRNFPELAGAAVGFYWPFKGELDLRGLARTLHEAGSRLSLP